MKVIYRLQHLNSRNLQRDPGWEARLFYYHQHHHYFSVTVLIILTKKAAQSDVSFQLYYNDTRIDIIKRQKSSDIIG